MRNTSESTNPPGGAGTLSGSTRARSTFRLSWNTLTVTVPSDSVSATEPPLERQADVWSEGGAGAARGADWGGGGGDPSSSSPLLLSLALLLPLSLPFLFALLPWSRLSSRSFC